MVNQVTRVKSDNLAINESYASLQHEKEQLLIEIERLVGACLQPYFLTGILILYIRPQQSLMRDYIAKMYAQLQINRFVHYLLYAASQFRT